jgi:rhamnulose-1-phosphate aldolase
MKARATRPASFDFGGHDMGGIHRTRRIETTMTHNGHNPVSELLNHVTIVLEGAAEVAGHLWRKGWAERNAGNISIDITNIVPEAILDDCPGETRTLPRPYPALAKASILTTATGSRMRAVAAAPHRYSCVLHLSPTGDSFNTICFDTSVRPSSEAPSHLAIHELLRQRESGLTSVIHTHPDRLIALSHMREFSDESALNRLLWSMHPETSIVVPQGIGVVPYEVPGSEMLARATVKALAEHRIVLWEKHGVVAVGTDLDEALDLVDTMDKAAAIYLLCRNAGAVPEGLSESQLHELAEAFRTYGE